MANIKKYTKKDGTTAYMFNVYLGKDPLTGKKKRTTSFFLNKNAMIHPTSIAGDSREPTRL
ncbi:hypothetical protein RMT88_17680 [Bacillus altitudinis]|uniref:hypothetical protein n=1 Tax=Bacillus altitudinis TaxID=293387 RepID=UPI000C1447F1|nr:hypothetical protein [Bacillus altitudinis]ATP92625.1 hypothetical protein CSE15_00930 [Bacillus altitudinis]MCY7715960.1 hypothetical protein [Bacillus altitudinis]MDT1121856.1 hypothetical protein [Bacillus altitudinis]